jgi:putative ABC transport system ATP-binding protein
VITLHDVYKTYRGGPTEVQALAGVSLEIGRGEFVAVVGPSGSGKSTLLHLMGGLDLPTAGEVTIDGTASSRMSDDALTVFRRRRVGFIFQSFNLLPTYSAEENVALPLRLDGRPAREVRVQVERALAQVGLLERRRHRPYELSGGEQQRLAIARALAIDPAFILADEPTGNLDTRTGAGILDLMSEAHRLRGCTVVLVTHDPSAAARAERVVTLRDGAVVG